MKRIGLTFIVIVTLGFLSACGNGETTAEEKKELTIGATSGPYSDMVTKGIKPVLEKKGYTVEVVEFSDYIQPNLALASGDLDANLFQHKVYMESFAEEHDLEPV